MADDGLAALAALPPGPALAAVLECYDPAALTEVEAVPVLQAWSRQRAHDHARMASALARVAALSRAAAGPTIGEWAGAEIAAALTWTERRAAGELEFAEEVAVLPLVAAASDDAPGRPSGHDHPDPGGRLRAPPGWQPQWPHHRADHRHPARRGRPGAFG